MRVVKTSLVIGAVVAAGLLMRPGQPPPADPALLETPAWRGGMPQYGEQLLLRRRAPNQRVLLLKHSNRAAVYRYDQQSRAFAAVPAAEWTEAGGPIVECGKQFPPPPAALRIQPESHRLFAGERQIPTAGSTVLGLTVSPGGRVAAVLSASGPIQPSLVPFAGASASGQRYHQVVSLPGAVVTGQPVRVPVQRDGDALGACWSAEEDAIVYHDILFGYLSVVEAAS